MSIAALVGTTLTGCSDDSDEENVINAISGYWENTVSTIDGRYGLYFQNDGKIKRWSVIDQYYEGDFGLYWYEDGEIHIKEGDKTPHPYELYYKVERLTESRLVISYFGGLAGTSYENARSNEFRKLPGKPSNSMQ